jgi:hypothetical protein
MDDTSLPTDTVQTSIPFKSSPQDLPPIAVDARALKTLRTLFHEPSSSGILGEMTWTDFLHAFTSTGFAAEKLYGSIWSFRPMELDLGKSIQFHEPHGNERKLAYKKARRIGRRLTMTYGWASGTFVLKEKGAGR